MKSEASHQFLSTLVVTGLMSVSTIHAATLVEWGEADPFSTAIVTSGENFDNSPSTSYASAQNSFNDGSYYVGGSGKSTIFKVAASNFKGNQVQNNASYDRIRVTQADGLGDQAWEYMIVWEDFLNPLGTDSLDTITYGGYRAGSGANYHFIIETAAGWYGTAASLVTTSGTTNLSVDVDAVSWYRFTPMAADSAAVSNVGTAVLTPDFSTVTSVGLYVQYAAAGASSAEGGIYIGYFQALSDGVGGGGNVAPVFGADLVLKPDATQDVSYTGQTLAGSANDKDGDGLTYTLDSGPSWLSIHSGVLSGTPTSSDLGLNTWGISVSDGNGGSDTADLQITVNGPPVGNVDPIFTTDPLVKLPAVQGELYAGSFVADATDGNGDDLTYMIISGPAWLTMSTHSRYSGTPSSADIGANSWMVSVSDGQGGTGTVALNIQVNATAPTFTKSPNVVVIISDDAGYADFSFMNGLSGKNSDVPTPHLDTLAARGVTFARAYVAANCQPTRAAITTGAYQQRVGNESVGNDLFLINQQDGSTTADDLEGQYEGLPVEVDTVWDRMKTLGYTTCAIGKWHLGQTESTGTWANPIRTGNRPQHQGIDEFYGMWHGSRDFTVGTYNSNAVNDPTHALQPRFIRECFAGTPSPTDPTDPDGYDVVVEYSKYGDVPSAPQYITNIFGDYAEQFVEDHYDDVEPFFLYVAHPAPHKPWTNESPDFNDPRIADWPDQISSNSGLVDNNRKQVASMMITMDREIGELMAKLEDPNSDGDKSDSISENTLVIFINDNGGVAGQITLPDGVTKINGTDNGKLDGFKGSSKEGGIRVPMILAGAGLDPSRRGTVFYDMVHGVDILPTSFEIGGGAPLTPGADHVDGVNLLPFLNGTDVAKPHDVLVHKWRGSFGVIKGDWKLQNSRNLLADPEFYDLYHLTNGAVDIDVDESESLIEELAYADLIAEMKRDLTDHEATFSKPRYAIRSNTIDTEPINVFDHHIFRPGLHNNWSGGVDPQEGTGGTRNWYKAGTTVEKYLFNTDSFPGAVLEFPVHGSSYVANNDYRRKTGMEFMLNKILLSGTSGGSATATISGMDLIFTNDIQGVAPQIALEASSSSSFTYDINLDVIMYDDLTLTGEGDAVLSINGVISEFGAGHYAPRGIVKRGSCTIASTGVNTYVGDTTVTEGTLSLTQKNTHNDDSSVRLASTGATLNLDFPGSDTVDRLFIGGVQQASGVYGGSGSGAANVIPQMSGSGTLTVSSSPTNNYAAWAATYASDGAIDGDHDLDGVKNGIEYFMGEAGSTFTDSPVPDASNTVTWPMNPTYAGTYGTDYYVQFSTPDLNSWLAVPIGDVAISAGNSIAFTLPDGSDPYFVRLVVNAD